LTPSLVGRHACCTKHEDKELTMTKELTTIDRVTLDEVSGGFVAVPEPIVRGGIWLWNRITGRTEQQGSTGGVGGGKPPTGQ
jgi:hypothetical protein